MDTILDANMISY